MAEEKTNKLQSRKFVVWLVWTILSCLILVICGAVVLITKSAPDSIMTLIEKVITSYLAVSLIYLGVNAGQKVGFAVSEAIQSKKTEG